MNLAGCGGSQLVLAIWRHHRDLDDDDDVGEADAVVGRGTRRARW